MIDYLKSQENTLKINGYDVIKNVSYEPILEFIYNFQFAEEETFSRAAEFIKMK